MFPAAGASVMMSPVPHEEQMRESERHNLGSLSSSVLVVDDDESYRQLVLSLLEPATRRSACKPAGRRSPP
jgi:hypothetical protein